MTFWSEKEQEGYPAVLVDGVSSPGVVKTIEINGTPINYDETKGYGLDGVFLRETGLGLGTIGFGCRLVDAEDRAALMAAKWLRAIKPSPPGTPQRIRTLAHPLLDLNMAIGGFTPRWRFTEIPFVQPATDEGGGGWMWLRFKNDRKQKARVGKPLDPTNAATGKVPNPRQEAIKNAAAALAVELAKGKS